jgi:hypothetical protein
MTRQRDHVHVEDYDAAARRADGPGALARHVQEHLAAQCPDCEDAWRRLGELRSTHLDRLAALTHPPSDGPSRKGLPATPADVEAQEAHTAEALRLHRNIRGEKYELLRTSPEKRAAKIRRARSRFRSPLLAELLIDHCRKLVRNDPVEAAELVALVPRILAWTEEAEPPPEWAPSLLARAAAHHANALRVAGDLHAAERAFIELRRRLAVRPLGEPAVTAEIASLEASLCIDLRRFEEAGQRLEHAAIGYRAATDSEGLAKTTISHATLLQTLGRPEELLRLLDYNEGLMQDLRDPYLEVCAVTVRVNALCDLKRFAAAGELLDASLDAYEASEDLNVGAIYRFLRGRVALGHGDAEAAEHAFEASRDAMLALGRAYDAALGTLYLAEALLAGGKTRKLAHLARGLVSAFRAHGVEGETLSALQLLARAVVAETLNATLLAELRHKLTGPAHPLRLTPFAG